MVVPQSKPLRVLVAVAMCAIGAFAVVSLAGGPDPLDAWWAPIFAVVMLWWIVPELRTKDEDESRRLRGLMWIGVVGAVGTLLLWAGELLF